MENQIIERVTWNELIEHNQEEMIFSQTENGYLLDGTVKNDQSSRKFQVKYQVACDSKWRTRSVHIEVLDGRESRILDLTTNGQGSWRQNGTELDNVCGCLDVDLEITPSTNLLPVRRLNLRVGGSAEIQAAWIRFPGLTVEPQRQVYTRLSEKLYRYESGNDGFKAEIEVDELGVPVRYGDIWLRKETIEAHPEEQ